MLPVLLLGGVLIFFGFSSGTPALGYAAIALTVLALFVMVAFTSAADVVFKAVLYNFATGKAVPEGLDRRELEQAEVHNFCVIPTSGLSLRAKRPIPTSESCSRTRVSPGGFLMLRQIFLSRFFRPRQPRAHVAALTALSLVAAALSACAHQVTFNVIDAATGEPIERSQPTLEHKALHDATYMREARSAEDGSVVAEVWTSDVAYIRFEKDGYHVLELHDALGFVRTQPHPAFLDRFPMVERTGTRQYDVFLTPDWALPLGEETATFPVFLY